MGPWLEDFQTYNKLTYTSLSITFLLQFYICLLFSVKGTVFFNGTFNNNNKPLSVHYPTHSNEFFSKLWKTSHDPHIPDEKESLQNLCTLLEIVS